MGQRPLAVRLDESLLLAIDRKRMELAEKTGVIPTRSDIVREALEAFVNPVGIAKKAAVGK